MLHDVRALTRRCPEHARRILVVLTALPVVGLAAGCEEARSSRADRRLDTAEARFDSLEARIERLERAALADSALAGVSVADSTSRRRP